MTLHDLKQGDNFLYGDQIYQFHSIDKYGAYIRCVALQADDMTWRFIRTPLREVRTDIVVEPGKLKLIWEPA